MVSRVIAYLLEKAEFRSTAGEATAPAQVPDFPYPVQPVEPEAQEKPLDNACPPGSVCGAVDGQAVLVLPDPERPTFLTARIRLCDVILPSRDLTEELGAPEEFDVWLTVEGKYGNLECSDVRQFREPAEFLDGIRGAIALLRHHEWINDDCCQICDAAPGTQVAAAHEDVVRICDACLSARTTDAQGRRKRLKRRPPVKRFVMALSLCALLWAGIWIAHDLAFLWAGTETIEVPWIVLIGGGIAACVLPVLPLLLATRYYRPKHPTMAGWLTVAVFLGALLVGEVVSLTVVFYIRLGLWAPLAIAAQLGEFLQLGGAEYIGIKIAIVFFASVGAWAVGRGNQNLDEALNLQ